MDYKNTETKLETLVTYFNEERINLNPVFQRGSVWNLKMRRELIKNIVRSRPIPAIFLYKDEDGSKYTFNILDGKQRLETILMFIGHDRPDLMVNTWGKYIFDFEMRKEVGFKINFGEDNKLVPFSKLDDAMVRNLREYPIPTIEITLNDTSLDEIISLFVDINQYGVKVSRLKIVRALKANDKLLNDVYQLVAQKQRRQQAAFVRRKRTDFSHVLRNLQSIARISDSDEQADRMWERLFELVLFLRSDGKHRKPAEILKSFIKAPDVPHAKLTPQERGKLTRVFDFLADAYKRFGLDKTRLATDQTHFYTMVTSLLRTELVENNAAQDLARALVDFNSAISGSPTIKTSSFLKTIKSYRDLSERQTSDSSKRAQRQAAFIKAVDLLIDPYQEE